MSANRSKRRFAGIVSLFALSSFTLLGCGDDGTRIINTPTRAAVTSTPDNIEQVGGTATYTLEINEALTIDPSSVLINVHRGILPIPVASSDTTSDAYQTAVATLIQDNSAYSVTHGPQVMTPIIGVKNRWTYHLTFPAPSILVLPLSYEAYFTAKDTQGNLIKIAATKGTNESDVTLGPIGALPLPPG